MTTAGVESLLAKGDVALDYLQQRFLAQHGAYMLEQCYNQSKHVAKRLQRCVTLKIIVANRLV